MIDERAEERASLYVLGLLEEGEAKHFADEMRENPDLSALVDDLQRATASLAAEVPPHPLPARLRARVLAQIRGDLPAASTVGYWWVGWAAAVVFFCGCVALLRERAQLESDLAALEQRDALASVEIVRLRSQLTGDPSAGAVAIWDGERQRGVLDVVRLPQVRTDQDYQLWLVDSAYPEPVSGGVIRVGSTSRGRTSFEPSKPVHRLSKFAVSLERQGGVEKAEGPMVLLSE